MRYLQEQLDTPSMPPLEYCIREDLKPGCKRMLAVLHPLKLIIDNYPEDQVEMLEADNNLENPELGKREIPFGRELWISAMTSWKSPPRKNSIVSSPAMKCA